jgi:hypothetical protein
MPVVYTKELVMTTVFVIESLIVMITNIFTKKITVDSYIIHMILLITTQYRYITIKNAIIFQEENEHSEKEYSAEIEQRKEKEIRALCRHHNTVI